MKKAVFPLLLILVLLFSGCAKPVSWKDQPEAYVKTVKYEEGFVIAQLADLHWTTSTDLFEARSYITNLVQEIKNEKGRIDLIVVTGDQFLVANQAIVKEFVDMMDSFEIPYAMVYGNHDQQGYYSPEWLSKTVENGKYSLYTEIYDDLPGRSNFIVNLTEDGTADSEVKWQIACLDTGVTKLESIFTFWTSYNNLSEEQVEWWKAEHDAAGPEVPVIAYYHIVEGDMERAFEAKEAGESIKIRFYKHEGFSASDENTSRFFDVAKNHGLKAAFFAHDHANDLTLDYEGVTLGYGVKSGKELYYTTISDEEAKEVGYEKGFDLIGSSVVTLHDGGDFDLEHFYYNENDDGVWKGWVKY